MSLKVEQPPTNYNSLTKSYEIVRRFVSEPTELREYKRDHRGNMFLMKDETDNPTGAYKWRGSAVKLNRLFGNELSGVVTASAGNHGQGVAWVASEMGGSAEVFVPHGTPPAKLAGLERLGAKVHLIGNNFDEATELARRYAALKNQPFIHPFDDYDIMDGQGTIGQELVVQFREQSLHYDDLVLFVPVGGGGLIGGVSRSIKALTNGRVKVVGVQVEGSDSAAVSFGVSTNARQKHYQDFSRIYEPTSRPSPNGSYCRLQASQPNEDVDGTRVNLVGDYCARSINQYVDEFLVVSPRLIGQYYRENPNSTLEPAGALSLVGAEAYSNLPRASLLYLVSIGTGKNQDPRRIQNLTKGA
ncbi:pyridoxal-phosphate dependent enzyme [Candidatus Nomurabacteria bacterium]|jgi:threonine dehydratase|nr:pyridoxal-phosphate dependent enzyme [Candidatus Saccharibacteria bacterium]MCB9839975.1 pyridoxal-phosphate dependent enzyme [Candidatus Nomurabacteria bacterium]